MPVTLSDIGHGALMAIIFAVCVVGAAVIVGVIGALLVEVIFGV
jgi:hypothetical protein